MKVRCKITDVSKVGQDDDALQQYIDSIIHLDEIDLRQGAEYTVYGLVFWGDHVLYYLCENNTDESPLPYHSAFFDLTDSSVPEGWSLSFGSSPELVPREWSEVPHFYENLVIGDVQAVEIFQTIKSRLGAAVLS